MRCINTKNKLLLTKKQDVLSFGIVKVSAKLINKLKLTVLKLTLTFLLNVGG